MAVYQRNIWETIFFRQAVRKNLYDCNISESLNLSQIAGKNIKIFRIRQFLRFNEAARAGGIHNKVASDQLIFTQTLTPRVHVNSILEVIPLHEEVVRLIILDKLNFIESLTVQRVRGGSDTLDIEEVLGLSVTRNLPFTEALILIEGATAYLINVNSSGGGNCPDQFGE